MAQLGLDVVDRTADHSECLRRVLDEAVVALCFSNLQEEPEPLLEAIEDGDALLLALKEVPSQARNIKRLDVRRMPRRQW